MRCTNVTGRASPEAGAMRTRASSAGSPAGTASARVDSMHNLHRSNRRGCNPVPFMHLLQSASGLS
jgi:hypothetical protein